MELKLASPKSVCLWVYNNRKKCKKVTLKKVRQGQIENDVNGAVWMPCYLPKNVKWLEMEKDKESAKKKVVPMVEFEPTTCSMRAGRDNQ